MRLIWPALAFLLLTAPAAAAPGTVATWFDPRTAREVMDARQEFDAAELRAIAAFERVIGAERERIAIPVQQYRNQVADPSLRDIRWTDEQRRRSAAATPARLAAVDAAERRLQQRTVAALQRFFARERSAGRMSRGDYERVGGGELGTNYFPSIRRRKWAGPAVTGFRQEIRTAEYRKILGEVRKLWAAQAAGASVIWEPALRPAW
jgi:hypothetical protein